MAEMKAFGDSPEAFLILYNSNSVSVFKKNVIFVSI